VTQCSQLVTATFNVRLQSSDGVEVGVDRTATTAAAAAAAASGTFSVALNSHKLRVDHSNVARKDDFVAVRRPVVVIPDHLYTHGQISVIPRLHDEAGSTSWLYERSSCARRAHVERTSCARRAGLMSWLSGHLNGVILQTFTKLHDERS